MYSESLAFNAWAKEEGLWNRAKLSTFSDTPDAKVAFDAQDYLSSVLTGGHATYEPLLPALGGLPFTLEVHVNKLLEELRSVGIKPTFVFPGGTPMSRDRHTAARESQKALASLNEAWNVYTSGRGEEAVKEFGKACTYHIDHILRHLFFYLHRNGVNVLVAPYEPSAQIAHMLETSTTKAIVGSASCLVFGASKVIVDFDWAKGHFHWISKDAIMRKLGGLNQDQLVDVCLLAGCSILPPHPEIENDAGPSKIIAAKNLLLRSGRDAQAACMPLGEHYLNLYRKAKIAAKHMVVIHPGGEVKQLNYDTCPVDSHEFIGQRLPDEITNYTSRGLLGFRVLNWRTRLEIFETPPLDGGEYPAYKDLVQKKLTPLRARTLALITRSLHRYWHRKDVELVCWFAQSDKQTVSIPDLADISKDADTWHVRASLMSQAAHVKDIDIMKTPLQYAIGFLSDESFAKKTISAKKDSDHSLLSTPGELLANTLWRFLQDRGYINTDHTLSAWGKALRAAFERANKDGYLGKTTPVNEAEEAIFLSFELFRLDVLNTRTLFPHPPYSERPPRGTESDRANINLISRIASLGSFQHRNLGYTGPLSRISLAFQQTSAAVRNSLRDLTEVHACNLLTSGSAVRTRDFVEYTDLGAQLPFLHEPDAGLSVMVKSHLDEALNTGERMDITKWFVVATDLEADLEKAWKMWDAVNAGVQAADSGIINSDTKNVFSSADNWLKDKRKYFRVVNGTKDSA